MLDFELLHPAVTKEALGFIPSFLSPYDPKCAREQLDEAYAFAGGWSPTKGFRLRALNLYYPGDPPLPAIARAHLKDETVLIFPHAWVAVVQPDGAFEVARMD